MTIPTLRCLFCSVLCLLSARAIIGDENITSSSTDSTSNDQAKFYTAADSASWAVTSARLSSLLGGDRQRAYDDFLAGCNQAYTEEQKQRLLARKKDIDAAALEPWKTMCTQHDEIRILMNAEQPGSVYNYTRNGYAKIRAPPELFALLQQFWKENRGKAETEWKTTNPYHNSWESPPTIVHLNQEHTGGSASLQSKIYSLVQPVLEEWTGQHLWPVSLYGIRSYHNGSVLAPHVDRMPLITSAIIQVDQDVDEPWPLEVYGYDGKATNVTMEPGDMVLYESHSVIHGRPFPMNGNYYANCFIHFEPYGPKEGELRYDRTSNLPPYIIPGSVWESEWRDENPDGWHQPIYDFVQIGDIQKVQEVLRHNPGILNEGDDLGWTILHEAARAGNLELVELCITHGADKDRLTTNGESPLNIARRELQDEDHEVVQYLKNLGAKDIPMQYSEL